MNIPPVTAPRGVTWHRGRGVDRPVSLSEVLDRVLAKGIVVAGEIVIAVAGIDLVYLGVNLVLCSTDTACGVAPPEKESSSGCC